MASKRKNWIKEPTVLSDNLAAAAHSRWLQEQRKERVAKRKPASRVANQARRLLMKALNDGGGFVSGLNMKTDDLFNMAVQRGILDRPAGLVRKAARYEFVIAKLSGVKFAKPSGRSGESAPKPRDAADEFYASYQWRKLRMEVLKLYGRRCQCCGATPDHGVVIHVDHIKPLRFFWDLRLEISNLQVLCEVCNHGKGNWDRTDWRQKP